MRRAEKPKKTTPLPQRILIIGQGIAGSVLAFTLQKAGLDIYLADGTQVPSASRIAAGLINPITGKRYAKSWNYDLFYNFAKAFYPTLEREGTPKIWYDYPIVRVLSSTLEENEWNLRVKRPEYQGCSDAIPHAGEWQGWIKNNPAFGIIQQSARVDFLQIMEEVRQIFEAQQRFHPCQYTSDDLPSLLSQYDRIICCEGYQGSQNPYFPGIPWLSAKGDRLLIRMHERKNMASILKKKIAVIPLGSDIYWVGANYYWEFDDHLPTAAGLEFNQRELRELLTVGYDIIDHNAAIRPVAQDRRPFLGWSAIDPRIGIFNGLGSKGALLAPYWAHHFASHILNNTPIDPEIDVQRFQGSPV